MDQELFINCILQVGTLNLEEKKSHACGKGLICSRHLRVDAFQSLDPSGGTEGHGPGMGLYSVGSGRAHFPDLVHTELVCPDARDIARSFLDNADSGRARPGCCRASSGCIIII